MNLRSPDRIPLHRRIGVRVGVLVALIVLLVDLVSMPIWMEYAEWLHPSWFEPEALRAAAQHYEETGEFNWLSAQDRRIALTESIIFALLLAALSALFVSWFATRRLRKLADQAREPATQGKLPGPYETRGADEISVLAEALNSMRERAQELFDQLELRDAQRREWIAQVSHDLRTPVSALSISVERLHELTRRGLSAVDETDELLSATRIDTSRIRALTEDLLEIGRLEIGDKLVLEPIPAGELIHQTTTALLPLAQDRHKELHSLIPEDLPTFQGDGRRLARALENLVVNSLQHAKVRVDVEVVWEGGWLRYVVKDDGPGFPNGTDRLRTSEESIPVCELTAHRSRPDSAGLGLQVASRVARAHDGSIGARNLPEGGAEIWLRLPTRN